MLIQYEDYEEVVTGVYDVLRIFIQIAAYQRDSEVKSDTPLIGGKEENKEIEDNCILMIETNKQILAIAIRHSSVYDCKKAYEFLIDLFQVSEKFANHREIIEAALIQIKPEASNRNSK